MSKVERELRDLMDLYDERYNELERSRQEAKKEGDLEHKSTVELMQRQCRIMIAELFTTMKNLNVLDEEEISFGAIKIK